MLDERNDEGRPEPAVDSTVAGEEPLRPGSEGVRFLSVVWDWSRSAALALVLFVVVRTFVVEAFKIPTGSMEGTLLVGDFLLVNKAVYGAHVPFTDLRLPALAEPGRGDVVVFHPPHEPDKNYVKRVVGLPGDVLEMKDKRLYVNGSRLPEPYARYSDSRGDRIHPGMRWQHRYLVSSLVASEQYHPSRDTWGPIEVPENHFFVLGDNRDNSEDSRYWGFVQRESIRGRPWIVYYSFDPRGADGMEWLHEVRWGRIGDAIE